mmetsp:Transcript_3804/g.9617  ORF Transcript_3804/g.9617 Transcript_3804/m.9617 type:complete len:247 (-) Transcript_3804:2-742(-)
MVAAAKVDRYFTLLLLRRSLRARLRRWHLRLLSPLLLHHLCSDDLRVIFRREDLLAVVERDLVRCKVVRGPSRLTVPVFDDNARSPFVRANTALHTLSDFEAELDIGGFALVWKRGPFEVLSPAPALQHIVRGHELFEGLIRHILHLHREAEGFDRRVFVHNPHNGVDRRTLGVTADDLTHRHVLEHVDDVRGHGLLEPLLELVHVLLLHLLLLRRLRVHEAAEGVHRGCLPFPRRGKVLMGASLG